MRDFLLGVVILVLAGVYLTLTCELPVQDIGDPIGPRLFPFLIGIGLAVSGILVIIETIRAEPADAQPQSTQTGHPTVGRLIVVAGVVAWLFTYFAVFEWLGFAISCSVFLLGFLMFFHRGRWASNLFTALCFAFGVNVVFTRFLGINLAPGLLPH